MCKRYNEISDAVTNVLHSLNEYHLDLFEKEKETSILIEDVLEPLTDFIEFLSRNQVTLFRLK